MNRDEVQARADRIRAFQQELEELEHEGVLNLSGAARARLDDFHAGLLQQFAADFDIDINRNQKQLSWGMRLASLSGVLAFPAAVFFFFYRFWGGLTTSVQVVLLVAASLFATPGVEYAARRERSLYFASLAGLVAVARFVLNLAVLGKIVNITPSQHVMLAWAAFALLLAYTYGLRLFLVAGLTSLTAWPSATVGTWSGCYCLSFGERPENFILAGLLTFTFGSRGQWMHRGFAAIYRVYGLLVVFIVILILANRGQVSYLPLGNGTIERPRYVVVLNVGARHEPRVADIRTQDVGSPK